MPIKGLKNDSLALDRWTELQFYFICVDILKERNNIMDVMDLIDSLAIFGTYPPEPIKMLAQEVISSVRYRPSKEEFSAICHVFGASVKDIKHKGNISNRLYYRIIEDFKQNPIMFYPRMQKPKLELITKFVTQFNKLKKYGI